MQIDDWAVKRRRRGTLAEMARRMVEKDAVYRETEKQLRRLYTLEMLIKHGNLQAAADAIGVTTMTIYRTLRPLTMADVAAATREAQ
jgi:hypothetical protein